MLVHSVLQYFTSSQPLWSNSLTLSLFLVLLIVLFLPFSPLDFFPFLISGMISSAARLSQLLNYVLPLFFFLLPVPLLSATSPDAAERYKLFPVCTNQCSPASVLNWEEDSCLEMTSFLSSPRKVVWRSIKELAGILSPLLQCFIHRLSNKHGKEHTDSWPSLFSSFPANLNFMCAQIGINRNQGFLVYSWALPEEVFTCCPVCPLRSQGDASQEGSYRHWFLENSWGRGVKGFHSMDWLMEKNGCWNDYNSSFHKVDIKHFNIQRWFPDFLWNLRFQVL